MLSSDRASYNLIVRLKNFTTGEYLEGFVKMILDQVQQIISSSQVIV